ncbi:MAG TPA: hypothetical protein G4N92_07255 [Anaerolineae bacterium]|nr:hypothetical protein [Anaerolineae bacterium]
MAKNIKKSVTEENVMRWIARIWSIASILFILVMFIGSLFSGDSSIFSLRDVIGLFFFPIGVFVGLVLAWRWEGIGGVITVASFFAFYLTLWSFDGRLPRGPYFALTAAPGLLFLVNWCLTKKLK